MRIGSNGDGEGEKLMTRDGAAEYMGIAASTLATWASTNKIMVPYIKIGACVRYRRSDLDKFLDGCMVDGKSERL